MSMLNRKLNSTDMLLSGENAKRDCRSMRKRDPF